MASAPNLSHLFDESRNSAVQHQDADDSDDENEETPLRSVVIHHLDEDSIPPTIPLRGDNTYSQKGTRVEITAEEIERMKRFIDRCQLEPLKQLIEEKAETCGVDVPTVLLSPSIRFRTEKYGYSKSKQLRLRSDVPILHYAASAYSGYGQSSFIDYLIGEGRQDINATDHQGETPLHLAARHSTVRPVLMEQLIKRGARRDIEDENGYMPLHQVCGNVNVLRKRPWQQEYYLTALDLLSDNGRLLTELKECEERGTPWIASPLSCAAMGVNAQAIRYLIDTAEILGCSDALIRHKDLDGCTALHFAAYNFDRSQLSKLSWILVHGARYSHSVVGDTSEDHIKCEAHFLLHLIYSCAKQFDVADSPDKWGRTPLFIACESKAPIDFVDQLIEEGCAKLTGPSLTAYHFAACGGDIGIMKWLLNRSDDLSLRDALVKKAQECPSIHKFETPLNVAARKGYSEIATLICESIDGWEDVMRLLLRNEACIEDKNNIKMSPLTVSVYNGNMAITRLLLRCVQERSYSSEVLAVGLQEAVRVSNEIALQEIVSAFRDISIQFPQFHLESFYRALNLTVSSSWRRSVCLIHSKLPGLTQGAMQTIAREKDGRPDTIFRKLSTQMPLVALDFLDDWMMARNGEISRDSENYKLTFDYRVIEDSYVTVFDEGSVMNVTKLWLRLPNGVHELRGDAKPWTTDRRSLQSTHPLTLIAENDPTGELLLHPVILSLLQHKWKSFGRKWFYAGLICYSLFVLFLSVYIIGVNIEQTYHNVTFNANSTLPASRPYALIESNFSHGVSEIIQRHCVGSSGAWMFVIIMYWLLVTVNVVKEFVQFASRGPVDYIFDFTNLTELFVYFGSMMLVGSLGSGCRDLGWIWQVAIFVVLLAWLNLLFFLRKVGIHIVMFFEILMTFANASVLLVLCLACFSLVLHMLMPTQQGFEGWNSLLKTFVMATGEMDYSDALYGDRIPYKQATYVVYAVFICSIAVVLMNQLVGLAVGDVKDILAEAKVRKVKMLVKLILEMEGVDRYVKTWKFLPDNWRKTNVIGSMQVQSKRSGSCMQKMSRWVEAEKKYRLEKNGRKPPTPSSRYNSMKILSKAWIGDTVLRLRQMVLPIVEVIQLPSELSNLSIKNAYLDRIEAKEGEQKKYEKFIDIETKVDQLVKVSNEAAKPMVLAESTQTEFPIGSNSTIGNSSDDNTTDLPGTSNVMSIRDISETSAATRQNVAVLHRESDQNVARKVKELEETLTSIREGQILSVFQVHSKVEQLGSQVSDVEEKLQSIGPKIEQLVKTELAGVEQRLNAKFDELLDIIMDAKQSKK